MTALNMLAEIKYPSQQNCMKMLEGKILGGSGPSVSGTTVS